MRSVPTATIAVTVRNLRGKGETVRGFREPFEVEVAVDALPER